ncbi:Fujikurins biosynthesis cluster transcription factor like protein [Verticillium longisporum]|nr:Fujikurins biosynthesis cluster transcription factor like protein [Verticillium longisporum]
MRRFRFRLNPFMADRAPRGHHWAAPRQSLDSAQILSSTFSQEQTKITHMSADRSLASERPGREALAVGAGTSSTCVSERSVLFEKSGVFIRSAMSHRHSCERCRQQKVRCLRDSQIVQKPSPGQSIPKCSRCAKAGTACVYSLRLSTRRPGSSTGGNISAVSQSMPSGVEKYPTPFDSVEEDDSSFQLDFDGFSWCQLNTAPTAQLDMGRQPRSAMNHPEAGDEDMPAADSWQALTIAAMASPDDSGDDEPSAARGDSGSRAADTGGLVLTTLACHQHLLAFFRAICDSIKWCVESVADEKRPPGGGSSLHSDGAPSTAQFTMVLQLLMHLINRLDRCLFPGRPPSPVSSASTSAYGGAGGDGGIDLVLTGQEAEDVTPDTTGIPGLAHALVRAIPDDHLRLRRTILQLQARMERLEAF